MEEEKKYSATEDVEHKFALLRDQKAPCAVFIGFNTAMDSGIRSVDDCNYDRIVATAERLRQSGIDAVPVFSEMATDPAKTVVTAGGIQTPVLKPGKLEEAAKQIFDALDPRKIMKESRDSYGGYWGHLLVTCSALEMSQMLPVAEISRNIYGKTFEAGLTHPDADEFIKLREKYGFDLEHELISEAEKKPDLLSLEQLKAGNETALRSVFRGGCLGDNPYACFAARETKAFAYATPDAECARMYSGLEGYYGVKLEATSSKGEESKMFGLVYEMEAAATTGLYGDWCIEQGYKPEVEAPSKDITAADWRGKYLETAVTPTKNKLKNIYLHLRKDGKDLFYPIPLKDERWQAFLALHRSSDTCQRGYMIERRRRILEERKVFSSLNNKRKFGLFKAKIKPLDLSGVDRKKVIETAGMTIEKKREIEAAQGKGRGANSERDIAERIKQLRCSRAKTVSINSGSRPREAQKAFLKFVTENKKSAEK